TQHHARYLQSEFPLRNESKSSLSVPSDPSLRDDLWAYSAAQAVHRECQIHNPQGSIPFDPRLRATGGGGHKLPRAAYSLRRRTRANACELRNFALQRLLALFRFGG